ncbi:MAG: ATP-dependent DNA helicase RecG [Candidatus Shapirobacteria bacterium]|jgi:ATP-dependent DNA helicase RecG
MNSLSEIPLLGPKTIEKLKKLNIHTPADLINHFPVRYIDFSKITKISDLELDSSSTVTGKIISFQNIYTRYGKNIQKAVVADQSGQINLIWFNQPYLSKNLPIGQTFSFAGTVSLFQNKKTIISPEYGAYNTGKIIAVYPETKGLSSKWFRKIIQTNILSLSANITENLPALILKKFHLVDKKQAYLQIHIPSGVAHLNLARNRLAVDEILSLQALSYLKKQKWLTYRPKKIFKLSKIFDSQITDFIKTLPFKLTKTQEIAWEEIRGDLTSKTAPTNRLLQGDVGSGKTIVAMLSCILASQNKSVSLLIAPTEILAKQHFDNFCQLLNHQKIPVYLLTAHSKIDLKKIENNSVLVATHAAIFKKSELKRKIGLLIIDEQHKFGVEQRSFLSSSSNPPHCLTMTATPIPRTISLTLLGNLDLSLLDSLPQNRLKIKTFLVPKAKSVDCYHWIKKTVQTTHQQVFYVCPFIEPSETLSTVKSAIHEFDHLKNTVFPDLKLDLIHGKMKTPDREKIINKFRENKTNILVTTPIIEVGIDIPNASVIVIQSADRFGLAQLHQLRGRVGRSSNQSYCYLFTESDNEKAIKRLNYLAENHHGQKIAEYDLSLRGPGEVFSTLQHGFPSLKIASFSNASLINQCQQILKYILDTTPAFDLHQLVNHTFFNDSLSS